MGSGARLIELGAYYEIVYDDVALLLNPIGQGAWNTRHEICIGIRRRLRNSKI